MLNKCTVIFPGFLLLVVLALAAMLFRYDVHVVSNPDGYAVAYRLDRWTGELRLIEEDQWYPVLEGNLDSLHEALRAPKSSSF